MTWAQRLKRVFNIDIETCEACGGRVKVIACIEDPAIIQRILDHLDQRDAQPTLDRAQPSLPLMSAVGRQRPPRGSAALL